MMRFFCRSSIFASTVVGVLAITPKLHAQTARNQTIENAIASLRHVEIEKLDSPAQEKKFDAIGKAWGVLLRAGSEGIDRLKQEINKIDASKERDDFFKLNTSRFLWTARRFGEVDTIAQLWNSADLNASYGYVFYTAFEAAQTHDARVLPLLKAVLRDDQGAVFLEYHMMNVSWPLTQRFIWGSFGPKGLPALLDVLKTSENPVEQSSAVILLAESCYLDALPAIRQLAQTGKGKTHGYAIEWLGEFGHPQDFEFLVGGLSSSPPDLLESCITALQQFEDLRAASPIAAILGNKEPRVRRAVMDCLGTLVTDSSLKALHDHSVNADDEKERKYCRRIVDRVLSGSGLSWAEYAKKKPQERAKLLSEDDKREESYRLKQDDKRLTHKKLLRVLRSWKKRHTIRGGKYEWVESRHILAAATPEDIERLLELRAAVYGRLSDECLGEVEILDDLIRRLGRRRYRKEVGVCRAVERK